MKALLRLHPGAALSLGVLVAITAAALLAPWIASHSYETQSIDARLQAPTAEHLFGTDALGRDLFSRILFGARVSLAVGFLTALSSLIVGTLIGACSGYWGGKVDRFCLSIMDFFNIFPMLLLSILLTLIVDRGFLGIFLSIALVSWVSQARLVRGMVLQVKEMPYVEAARAIGVGPLHILSRHILPNCIGPIIVALTFQVPTNIMTESFLSFVGLGLQPPYASWGTLASEGMRALRSYPHLILFPGIALFVTLLAFNLLGDGLRDWLDPRARIES